MSHDTCLISKIFKSVFSNLPNSLLIKLPKPPDKYSFKSVIQYCSLAVTVDFCLVGTTEKQVLKIIQDSKNSKAAGVDELLGRFLKDVADILGKPVSALCNLLISLGVFPGACKVAKLKFKKGKNTDPSNYRPISLFSVIFKIIEKVVHDQTNAFLSDENILCGN